MVLHVAAFRLHTVRLILADSRRFVRALAVNPPALPWGRAGYALSRDRVQVGQHDRSHEAQRQQVRRRGVPEGVRGVCAQRGAALRAARARSRPGCSALRRLGVPRPGYRREAV